MLNIVLADLFRLTKGKSTAIFLGVLSLMFTLLMMTTDITVSKFEFYLIFIVGLSVGSIAISISSVIRVYCDDVTSITYRISSEAMTKTVYRYFLIDCSCFFLGSIKFTLDS